MSHRPRNFFKNPPLSELCSSSIRVDLPSFAGCFPPSAIRSPFFSPLRVPAPLRETPFRPPLSPCCLLTALRSGCPPWATHLSFPLDMRYRAGVRSRSCRPSGCLRQGWFAFLPECLTLRATHVAYRANPRLLGSQPAPAGMCYPLRRPSRAPHDIAPLCYMTNFQKSQSVAPDHPKNTNPDPAKP